MFTFFEDNDLVLISCFNLKLMDSLALRFLFRRSILEQSKIQPKCRLDSKDSFTNNNIVKVFVFRRGNQGIKSAKQV